MPSSRNHSQIDESNISIEMQVDEMNFVLWNFRCLILSLNRRRDASIEHVAVKRNARVLVQWIRLMEALEHTFRSTFSGGTRLLPVLCWPQQCAGTHTSDMKLINVTALHKHKNGIIVRHNLSFPFCHRMQYCFCFHNAAITRSFTSLNDP